MKKLSKLDFDSFKMHCLLTSHLKNLTGGATATSRSGMKDGTNGPDFIDDCSKATYFSNGSNEDDDTV